MAAIGSGKKFKASPETTTSKSVLVIGSEEALPVRKSAVKVLFSFTFFRNLFDGSTQQR